MKHILANNWKRIIYYDSLLDLYPKITKEINVFSQMFDPTIRFKEKPISEKEVPSQYNSFDCGVFVMEFARHLLYSNRIDFIEEDMPDIRQRIFREIFNDKLEPNFQYHGLERIEKLMM